VTFGYGFTRAEAWPQALQAMVDERGPGVEVFNMALPGWSTRQERYAYERIARRYRPDAVVLAVVLNDIEDLENNLSRPPPVLIELFRRSALVRRLMDPEGREIRSVDELFRDPEPARVASAYQRLFAEIRRLRDDVRQDGGRLVVMVLPDADEVGPSPPPPRPEARVAAFLRAEGLEDIDVLTPLRSVGPDAFADRLHLTPRGSARVASSVLAAPVVRASAYATAPLRAALSAAGEAPDPRQAPPGALAARAADASPAVRAEAAWALGRRGARTAPIVAALAGLLGDVEPAVRAESAHALAVLGPAGDEARSDGAAPATEARLVGLLDDAHPEVRWAAADALAAEGVHAPSAVGWLVRALASPDPYVRGFAAWSLGLAGPSAAAAAPALEGRLHDDEPGVRTLAVRALGNLGRTDAPVVAGLADVLAHGEGEGRWRAARALGKLGPAAAPAVGALARALSDPDQKLRRECALALDEIGPPAGAAVSALVAAQHDPAAEVREAAENAIRTITASR
jgi:HEAT repeat protein